MFEYKEFEIYPREYWKGVVKLKDHPWGEDIPWNGVKIFNEGDIIIFHVLINGRETEVRRYLKKTKQLICHHTITPNEIIQNNYGEFIHKQTKTIRNRKLGIIKEQYKDGSAYIANNKEWNQKGMPKQGFWHFYRDPLSKL